MLGKPSYANLKFILITVASLIMAWLHWYIAKDQLATIGFAAGNRSPNHFAYILGWLLVFVALANILFAYKTKRFGRSVVVLTALVIALPILYLQTW